MKAPHCIIQDNFIAAAGLIFTLAAPGAWSQLATFTQITDGPVVSDAGNPVGVAWGDFSNTGFLDLLVCQYGQTNTYYHNNGDGTFARISPGAPVLDPDYHVGPAAGDYDNDGHLDLSVTAGAFGPEPTHIKLFHNNGDGTFSSVSGGVVTNQLGRFSLNNWVDYDHDGFPDLFIGNHGLNNDNGGKNMLFHNNGDGTFTQVTNDPVVSDISVGFCSAWEDYDNDGFPDLLVINYTANAQNFLYHNNGNGTFTRILTNIIATDSWPSGARCAAWADYDNDGLPDLFVTDSGGVGNQLYHNEGNGKFTRVTSGPELVPAPGGSFNGCAWGDFDNDGYLDLFVSGNGENNALFRNNGDGTFTAVTSGPEVSTPSPSDVGAAVSWVDYDNDGFLDLFVGVF